MDADFTSSSASTGNSPRTFWCFISYRHADNKEPGRQWATWLHQALETYEVPADLVGRKNQRGEMIPERIFPVFRDEEELPADAELSRPIEAALAHSRYLVVLCSPAAVASRFVAAEILRFKQLGKQDSILAAIIAGEPNASDDPAKAHLGECFPHPLRYRADGSGSLTTERCEPIAADFRLPDGTSGWTTPAAHRESLQDARIPRAEAAARVAAHARQRQLMLLKIIAGVLGIPLGELTKRDQAHQLALQQRRARVLRRWLAAVTALSVAATAAGWIAYRNAMGYREQRDVAARRTDESQARLIRMMFERARGEQQGGRGLAALPWLLEAAKLDAEQPRPTSRLHARRIRGMLTAAPRLSQVAFHDGVVHHVTFSPDGARFVTASDDYTARLWDTETGRPLGEVMEHDDPVRHAEFSPDGRFVVTAAGDTTGRRGAGSARVWDAATGAAVTAPLRHAGKSKAEAGVEGRKGSPASDYVIRDAGAVTLARFSPDGHAVVSAGDDRMARLWNAATGTPLGKPLAHAETVTAVAFSPDGTLLATGDASGAIRLWDARTGLEAPLRRDTSRRQRWRITNVDFSPDGMRIVTSGGEVLLWSVADRSLERAIPLDFSSGWSESFAAFSPDGTVLAIKTGPETARFWDLAEMGWVARGTIAHEGLSRFAFSDAGRLFLTVGTGVRIWDAARGTPVTEVLPYSDRGHSTIGSAARFSPDETRVAVAGGTAPAAQIWTLPSPTVHAFAPGEGIQAEFSGTMTVSPDGGIALVHHDARARLWNTQTGEPVSGTIHLPEKAAAVRLSARGRFAAIVHDRADGDAGTTGITLLEATTGLARVPDLTAAVAHPRQELSLAFSPDERLLAIGYIDGIARVIDAASGDTVASLRHDLPVHALAFSADGRRLAVGCCLNDTFNTAQQARVQVWNLPEAQPVGPPLTCKGWIERLAVDPDGRILVTHGRYPLPGAGAEFPSLLGVWDIDSGKPLLGPKNPAAEDDDQVRRIGAGLWGAAGAARLLRLTSEGTVFSADGSLLAKRSGNEITILDAATGRTLPTLPILANAPDTDFERMVAFSPDGRLLAAAGRRDWATAAQLGVWDVATGDRVLVDTPVPLEQTVRRVVFSDDSQRVQVEGDTAVWQVPLAPSIDEESLDGLDTEVALATGLRIDREREASLVPIDLAETWNRRPPADATPADRAARHVAEARAALAARRFLVAVRALDRAITARVDAPAEWYLLRARSHLELRDAESARRDATLAAQAAAAAVACLPPQRQRAAEDEESFRATGAQVQAVLGTAATLQHLWQAAVRHLEAATTAPHPDTAWYKPLAFAYAELGEHRKATDALGRSDPWGIGLGDDLARAEQQGQLGIQLLIWDRAVADDGDVHQWLHRPEANHPAILRAARGAVHFRRHDWQRAIDDLTAAIEGGAGQAWIRTLRGAAHERVDEFDEALADYSAAIAAAKPNDVEAVSLRGRLRRSLGDLEGAIADATAAIEGQPGAAEGWRDRGRARLASRDAAAALADLDEAVRLGDDDPSTLDARAHALQLLGRIDDAIRDATAAIESSPDDATLWESRADFLAGAQRFDAALEDARKSLALSDNSARALLCYGRCLLAMGRPEDALVPQRRAAEIEPAKDSPWRDLTVTHMALHQWSDAIVASSRVVALAPRDHHALSVRAACHAAMQHWDDAIADLRRASTIAPEDVAPAADEVLFLQSAGRIDDARAAAGRLVDRFMAESSPWSDLVAAFETVLPLEPPILDFAAMRSRFVAGRDRGDTAAMLVAICDAELGRYESAASRLEDIADAAGGDGVIAAAYLAHCRRRTSGPESVDEPARRLDERADTIEEPDLVRRTRRTMLRELVSRRLRPPGSP